MKQIEGINQGTKQQILLRKTEAKNLGYLLAKVIGLLPVIKFLYQPAVWQISSCSDLQLIELFR
jgi:hypothetical protein